MLIRTLTFKRYGWARIMLGTIIFCTGYYLVAESTASLIKAIGAL